MGDAAFYWGVDGLESQEIGAEITLTLLNGDPVPRVVIVVVEIAGRLFGNPIVDHTLRAQYTVRKIQRVCEPCTLRRHFLQKPVLKQNLRLEELFWLDTDIQKALAS